MSHVERYCDWKLGTGWQQQQQEGGSGKMHAQKCVVYLASDDSALLDEVQKQYRHIHVVAHQAGVDTGGKRAVRGGVGGFSAEC